MGMPAIDTQAGQQSMDIIPATRSTVDREVQNTAWFQHPAQLGHDALDMLHMIDAVLDDQEIAPVALAGHLLAGPFTVLDGGIA